VKLGNVLAGLSALFSIITALIAIWSQFGPGSKLSLLIDKDAAAFVQQGAGPAVAAGQSEGDFGAVTIDIVNATAHNVEGSTSYPIRLKISNLQNLQYAALLKAPLTAAQQAQIESQWKQEYRKNEPMLTLPNLQNGSFLRLQVYGFNHEKADADLIGGGPYTKTYRVKWTDSLSFYLFRHWVWQIVAITLFLLLALLYFIRPSPQGP
jgi:hypothetical protein